MPKPGAWGQARMPPSSSGPFPASGQWPNAVNPIFKVQNTVHVLARDPQWFVSRYQPTGLPLGLCCLQLILSTPAKLVSPELCSSHSLGPLIRRPSPPPQGLHGGPPCLRPGRFLLPDVLRPSLDTWLKPHPVLSARLSLPPRC